MTDLHSAAYLEALGLEPGDILAEGWTGHTYQRIARLSNGKVELNSEGDVLTATGIWPANFNADVFRYLRRKDGFNA